MVVKAGSVPHPMEDNHYIELIQILKDGEVIAEKMLFPHDEPKPNSILKMQAMFLQGHYATFMGSGNQNRENLIN